MSLKIMDFWAPWCGPCKTQGPIIEELEKEAEGVKIEKINVDENPERASEFGVMSIPTIIFEKNGEIKETLVGVQSKDKLLKLIEEHK